MTDMAYSNKFAVCVLVNGKIMKELRDGTVGVPFGAEYTLRLFNKHDRKAVAKVSLDTENVSQGGFIIDPHGKVDIARRADRDTAFRFVELGSDAALLDGKPSSNESREMGLIEVNFHLEKERPKTPIVRDVHHHHHYDRPHWSHPHWTITMGTAAGGPSHTKGIEGIDDTTLGSTHVYSCSSGVARGMIMSDCAAEASPVCDNSSLGMDLERCSMGVDLKDGCTVEGRSTGQQFSVEYVDYEATSTLIKLFLQGFKNDQVKVAR